MRSCIIKRLYEILAPDRSLIPKECPAPQCRHFHSAASFKPITSRSPAIAFPRRSRPEYSSRQRDPIPTHHGGLTISTNPLNLSALNLNQTRSSSPPPPPPPCPSLPFLLPLPPVFALSYLASIPASTAPLNPSLHSNPIWTFHNLTSASTHTPTLALSATALVCAAYGK